MVQNIQHTSDEIGPVTHSADDARPDGPIPPQADTLKIVSCPICRAIYIPSAQQQEQARNAFPLLEAAFLRVCHFCFRCQRPSCPQCWDHEHNLCASCSHASHLPFRASLTSFEGLIFSPPYFPQVTQGTHLSFTCLRNGHFYTSNQGPVTTAPAAQQSLNGHKISAATRADSSYPGWLQEIMGQKGNYQPVYYMPKRDNPPHKVTPPEQTLPLPHTSSLELVKSSRSFAPLVQPPTEEEEKDLAESSSNEEESTLSERIENALIFITSFILATIVIMIVMAICSPDINTLFFHLVHIDIRAEIAYLLQLI